MSRWRTPAAVFLLFGLLGIALTWPLAHHLGSQIIGPFYGDNLEYVWKLWWVKHALLDLKQSPLLQPDIYYPYGYPLAYGEITPIHTYLGLPLTALVGPVATYNLFVLVSFPLTGLFTFLLVHRLTQSAPAGLIAGLVFTFCPYRMARIAGNLPLVDTHWLPLMLLFLERFARQHRWRDAALAGLAFAASALSSWYYAAMIGLLLPIYLLVRWRPWRRQDAGVWLRGGVIAATVAAIPIIPFLLPYLSIQVADEARIPLEQAAFWSASLTDYMTPNPRHSIWGPWVQEHLTFYLGGLPYEFLLGWGLGASILALYGWRRGQESAGRGWGWWILAALILSLGPAFTLFNRIVTLPVPAGLANGLDNALGWLGQHSLADESFGLAPAGRLAIPLPALLLRWFVPGLAGMRSWGRFAMLATFGVAVLAGAGVAAHLAQELETRPTSRPGLRRWAVTALLGLLILFEFHTGQQQLIRPGPRPVDEWLASRPGQSTIIQLPLGVALSGPQMYYAMHHGQRVASGYGTFLPILFEQRYPELLSFPADESLDILINWGGIGIDYVLIDERDIPISGSFWDEVAAQDRLKLLDIVGQVRVYEIH